MVLLISILCEGFKFGDDRDVPTKHCTFAKILTVPWKKNKVSTFQNTVEEELQKTLQEGLNKYGKMWSGKYFIRPVSHSITQL